MSYINIFWFNGIIDSNIIIAMVVFITGSMQKHNTWIGNEGDCNIYMTSKIVMLSGRKVRIVNQCNKSKS